jgi:hypothetical protein
MSDSLLCHGLLRDNTYMSWVEVDIPLHSVLVVGSCGTLMYLCLFQILLYLILHLYIQFDLLAVHCIEEPDYTSWGYTIATHCCIVVTQCYIVSTYCCMEVVSG